MPTLEDIPVELAAEEVLAAQGRRPARPELLRAAQAALALGATLWQPRAVYDWFDLCEVDGERVHLKASSGQAHTTALHVGPKADLRSSARRLLVGVSTIGPALEQKVRTLRETCWRRREEPA